MTRFGRSRPAIVASMAGALALACSIESTSRVQLATSLTFPRALLDNVQRIDLTVYESSTGARCDSASGTASGVTDSTAKLASEQMSGCAGSGSGGGRFCTQLSISRSGDTRVFVATGIGTNNQVLATGCAEAVVNQEQLPIAIRMVRYVTPSVCGNGKLEPTEQCEPAGSDDDPVCDSACHTKEVLVSQPASQPNVGPVAQNVGDKTKPFFFWPAKTGKDGRFIAVWADKSPPTASSQIAIRFLSDSLLPADEKDVGPAAARGSTFLPRRDDIGADANAHDAPVVLTANGKYFVFYSDNSGQNFDVRLRSMSIGNPTVGDQAANAPVGINGPAGGGEAGLQTAPSAASVSDGRIFVAWQSSSTVGPGRIFGRTFNANTNGLTTQVELSTGVTNEGVAVASLRDGWAAVWQSGGAIRMRTIDSQVRLGEIRDVSDSARAGAEGRPTIATLPDGRFAVAWMNPSSEDGDIFVQRFKADGEPIADDQATRVNNLVGTGRQSSPVIASANLAGGVYAIAWVDESSGHVHARYLSATGGYLFNSVDGQSDEFVASFDDGHTRARPAAAIGGKDPFVAIGWEDQTADHAGIYARRFPLPQ